MTIDVFIPCFVDQLYPETGMNMLKILRKAGIDYRYNPKQTCCGQPSFNSGYWDETLPVAKKFLRDFDTGRHIVCPSASCAAFVKEDFPKLSDEPSFLALHKKIADNLFELTDFLVNVAGKTQFDAEFHKKVTYHDACSALREYGIKNEPRQLLSQVKGLQLVEMKENDTCCGFGGTFAAKNEPISTAMAEQKIENAMATGAEYIVSTEASCLMHLEGYITKHKLPVKTIHIADILSNF